MSASPRPRPLMEYMAQIPDPRVELKCLHDVIDVIMIVTCGTIVGADDFVSIADFARAKEGWLRDRLGLKLRNGIPSHDTLNRVFALIRPEAFTRSFVAWVADASAGLPVPHIPIDGKTMRGSKRRTRTGARKATHIVSAWAHELGLTLAQVRTEDKSNEITAIPELLEALLLKGAVVTIDAMGCQQGITQKVVQGGADYVLAVKDNQPGLCEALRELFAAHDARGLKTVRFGEHTEIGKDHGRIETRRCVVSKDIQWLAQRERWCGVRSVAMIESTRQIGEQSSTERRYFISSLRVDAKRLGEAIRAHWGIENSMHWVLDVAFGEDQCRARVKNAAQNFAILRRIVINLLRADPSTKVGAKTKRLKASADDRYRAHILGLVALQ